MKIRKIIVKTEIDTTNFDLLRESLWELDFKIEDWCKKKKFVTKCRIIKYEEKSKH